MEHPAQMFGLPNHYLSYQFALYSNYLPIKHGHTLSPRIYPLTLLQLIPNLVLRLWIWQRPWDVMPSSHASFRIWVLTRWVLGDVGQSNPLITEL